jgi:hypothetical protein
MCFAFGSFAADLAAAGLAQRALRSSFVKAFRSPPAQRQLVTFPGHP